jgi:hypothetical protein
MIISSQSQLRSAPLWQRFLPIPAVLVQLKISSPRFP